MFCGFLPISLRPAFREALKEKLKKENGLEGVEARFFRGVLGVLCLGFWTYIIFLLIYTKISCLHWSLVINLQHCFISLEVMVTAGANQAYTNLVCTLLDEEDLGCPTFIYFQHVPAIRMCWILSKLWHCQDSAVLFRPFYFNHRMALQMTGGHANVVLAPSTKDCSLEDVLIWNFNGVQMSQETNHLAGVLARCWVAWEEAHLLPWFHPAVGETDLIGFPKAKIKMAECLNAEL